MKKTLNEKTVNSIPVSRKVLGVVALVGLFACGVFIGTTLNNNHAPSSDDKVIKFSEHDCYSLINKMTSTDDADMVEILKEVYNDNCANRIIYTEPVTVPDNADDEPGDVTTCERIEQLLAQRLVPEEDSNWDNHLNNANIYARLAERGCPENVDKYRALAAREIELANEPGCEQIERLLAQKLIPEEDGNPDSHLNNANIYARLARLAERSCPEIVDKYRALAAREIEIATALIPVEEMSEPEVENVVDVYKKVKMQAAAQQVIDTLQKASEPTIDFILKLEKIINEE